MAICRLSIDQYNHIILFKRFPTRYIVQDDIEFES